ncbi:MAG TPA: pyridoxal-phosphate dependent enzyme [Kofleriaceae bacterium]|nr:pyridoxal-phosphate dependent enzyme [Kofleriaceae bacterium]
MAPVHAIHEREPPRVRLANLPTRGHWLRYGQEGPPRGAGRLVPIWLKRDDETGSEVAGNKVRKLEYLLAEALGQGATHVITCGGEQSNHARTTAFAAAQLGLASLLILCTGDPAHPPRPTGNLLLARLAGAELLWISSQAWPDRAQIMAEAAERVRRAGGRPYAIPEGGSDALGAWGYIRAMHELVGELQGVAAPDHPVTVVYPAASGGTGAGLILGAKLLGLPRRGIRIAGISVRDDRARLVAEIGRICAEIEARWRLGAAVTEADIDIIDRHVGRGYGRSQPEELATLRDVCRSDGVVLDPVYTGKAFHGMITELGADPGRFGAAVAFLHTGGLFGLLASSELAAAL